jgi:Flp pilus assembly protein TadD
MSRLCAHLGVVAVSALLCGTALASPSEQTSSSLAQSIETGVRDAQIMRTQKDLNGAVRVLGQLMLVAADDPRVVGEYGKVLIQQGRAAEALDFLRRAVQLQQNDWTLYSALGVAYDQQGDYVNARAAYDRALVLKPGESAVLNNYAMSRLQAGDLDGAKHLIADASAASKDERVTRNLKMISALKLPAAKAKTAPVAVATAPTVAGKPGASASPHNLVRTLTPAEGRNVVMQAVPFDPKAGPVARPKTKKAASAKLEGGKPAKGIPSLRLANDRQ